MVACSGVDNIIVVSSDTNNVSGTMRMPYYTKDRGKTWKPVTLPTAWTFANLSGVHFAYYLNREILVADKSKLGRFYFLVQADDAFFRGVLSTDDGGGDDGNASLVRAARRKNNGSWDVQCGDDIESPVTNHLYMGAGSQGNDGVMGTGQLFRSTDGGATFTALPDVNEPAKFGFGAPSPCGRRSCSVHGGLPSKAKPAFG